MLALTWLMTLNECPMLKSHEPFHREIEQLGSDVLTDLFGDRIQPVNKRLFVPVKNEGDFATVC